jgi:repressor LexA
MQGLTRRQSDVLAMIKRYISEKGYPPTRAEVAKEFGWKSANAADEHIAALAKKGAIIRDKMLSRGIRIPGN